MEILYFSVVNALVFLVNGLQLHYEPTVVTYSKFLVHGAPSQGKQALTSDLARKYYKLLSCCIV